MADEDRFPVAPDTESSPDEAGDGAVRTCPECGRVFHDPMAAAKLGLHRRRVHGVAGDSKTTRKRRRRATAVSTKSSTPAPRVPSTSRAVRDVRDSLQDAATKLGALAYPVAPIPALYLRDTSEQMAETVSRMAARNPKLLRWLQGSSDAMDYLALGTWIAGFAVAVGVQVGRVPVMLSTPDGQIVGPNPLVGAFRIDELYAEAARDFADQGERGAGTSGPSDVGNGQAPAAEAVVSRPG